MCLVLSVSESRVGAIPLGCIAGTFMLVLKVRVMSFLRCRIFPICILMCSACVGLVKPYESTALYKDSVPMGTIMPHSLRDSDGLLQVKRYRPTNGRIRCVSMFDVV